MDGTKSAVKSGTIWGIGIAFLSGALPLIELLFGVQIGTDDAQGLIHELEAIGLSGGALFGIIRRIFATKAIG